MKKNRTIPFGYMMQNGEIRPKPTESKAVQDIFNAYLNCSSLLAIANQMSSQGISYNGIDNIWNKNMVKRILENEKYLGRNGYPAIVDEDTFCTFNRVQQELARRSSKRKISDKTTTEQGKYSGKYALSELMICGHCGTPYRRQMWKSNGNRYAVWRCVSRLDHGKRYCTDSPTIHEDKLHRAILQAVNEYLGCRNEIAKILKANIGSVLECKNQQEILNLEKRLKELDKVRNDLISLISEGGCEEDTLDAEFAKIHAEEQSITEKLPLSEFHSCRNGYAERI